MDWIYKQCCIGGASVGHNKPLTQALKKREPLDDILKRGVIVSADDIYFLTSVSVHHTVTSSYCLTAYDVNSGLLREEVGIILELLTYQIMHHL